MDERTEREMFELAASRAEAIGKPVIVTAFTSSDRMHVTDLDYAGDQGLRTIDQGSVPLLNPTPREEDGPGAA
jgi:hypothetical protein